MILHKPMKSWQAGIYIMYLNYNIRTSLNEISLFTLITSTWFLRFPSTPSPIPELECYQVLTLCIIPPPILCLIPAFAIHVYTHCCVSMHTSESLTIGYVRKVVVHAWNDLQLHTAIFQQLCTFQIESPPHQIGHLHGSHPTAQHLAPGPTLSYWSPHHCYHLMPILYNPSTLHLYPQLVVQCTFLT